MNDLWKIVKGGLALILAAMLCGLAYGSCIVASQFIQRLAE